MSTKRFYLPSLNSTRLVATRVRLLDDSLTCLLDLTLAPPVKPSIINECKTKSITPADTSSLPTVCDVKSLLLKNYLQDEKVVVVGYKVWESLAAININGCKRVRA